MAVIPTKVLKLSDGIAPGIIDVSELPTTNIRNDVFYRLRSAKFWFFGSDTMTKNVFFVKSADDLPEVGVPFINMTDQAAGLVGYYSEADNDVYGYVDSTLVSELGDEFSVGWYTIGQISELMSIPYAGIVSSTSACVIDEAMYVVMSRNNLYTYTNSWAKVVSGYEQYSGCHIVWDGVIGDRPYVDMDEPSGDDYYARFVKVSDSAPNMLELVYGTLSIFYKGEVETIPLDESNFESVTELPGGYGFGEYVVIIFDEDAFNSVAGDTVHKMTNGVYFVDYVSGTDRMYVCQLSGPIGVEKIDGKFIDTSSLDIYSRDEIDSKFADTYNKNETQNLINSAIGSAMGGSY